MMDDEDLQKFLKILRNKPRGVAIFGPSYKRGFYWIKSLINLNYDGAIIPIHPKLTAAVGIPCYKTLDEVPEHIHVDYAIIAVPKSAVPDVLWQCIRRRVNVATVFTSGYSEEDPVEGRRAEQELLDILEEGKRKYNHRLRILGPNCIGSYYPKHGLGFRTDLSDEFGNIGVISQSGGLAINIALKGKILGIKFSHVVSVGNAIDLGPNELLQLMEIDKETKFIGCYFESLGKTREEGRKLLEVVRRITRKKPVLIWKGGRTERGSKAASSHTGALSTNQNMFKAFIAQSGAVPVDSFEELMDTFLAYQLIRRFPGKNIAMISISGGSGVTATDEIVSAGLNFPELSPETQEKIAKLTFSDVGMSVKNPVDLGASYFGFSVIKNAIMAILQDPVVDILFMEISSHYIYNATVLSYKDFPSLFFGEVLEGLKNARKKTKKPVFIIMPEVAYEREALNDRHIFLGNKFPVFPTVRRAAKVLKNMAKHEAVKARNGLPATRG